MYIFKSLTVVCDELGIMISKLCLFDLWMNALLTLDCFFTTAGSKRPGDGNEWWVDVAEK